MSGGHSDLTGFAARAHVAELTNECKKNARLRWMLGHRHIGTWSWLKSQCRENQPVLKVRIGSMDSRGPKTWIALVVRKKSVKASSTLLSILGAAPRVVTLRRLNPSRFMKPLSHVFEHFILC